MTLKNKIYLVLSIFVLIGTLFSILTSSSTYGILDGSLSIQWIVIFVLTLLLPIINLAEIIINRNEWNIFYWMGLIFNVLTIIFVMRYFKISLL